MSLARVYTTKKVRKDWTCDKCGAPIRKGVDGRVSFTVGFRGFERTRCTKPECYPTPSERESSAVASVYAAQEAADFSTAASLEDLEQMVQDVADACEEVASEYESNEMYEINADLQERAETVRQAGEDLRSSWADGLEDEPTEDDFDEDADEDEFETAHDEWLEQAREAYARYERGEQFGKIVLRVQDSLPG